MASHQERIIMKKIVIIPGVGLFDDLLPDYLIVKLIKKHFPGWEIEWFNWKHQYCIPNTDLCFPMIRKWFCEVVYDFETISNYAEMIKVPEADYYIGHSAGSILSLMQNKPAILCGSPARLLDMSLGSYVSRNILNAPKVYNLIHKRDVIAYPLPYIHVQNEIVDTNWWRLSNWEPISAHLSYLKNKSISMKIIEILKQYERE